MGDIVHLRSRPATPGPSLAVRVFRAFENRLLVLERLALWKVRPRAFPAPTLAPPDAFPALLYQRVHPIAAPGSRLRLLREERAGLDLAFAAAALDGLLVTEDRPLSFWRALGRIRAAELLHEPSHASGRLVPAEDGARLLSGALLALATTLGWRVLERHQPEPAAASGGREASVSWPHRDLRVAPREGRVRLEMEVRGDLLHVRVRGAAPARGRAVREAADALGRHRGAGGYGRDGVLLRLDPRGVGR